MRRALPLTLALLACGCGYSTKPLQIEGAKTIAVPIFQNDTMRRFHEFDLTNAVAKMIQARTRYTICSEDRSDLVLEGKITNYETPGLVESSNAQLIESEVLMTIKITVKDRRTGAVRVSSQTTVVAPFSGHRGQNEDSARFEAYEKLARWVVTMLEMWQ